MKEKIRLRKGEILVDGTYCWRCKTEFSEFPEQNRITKHHAIPLFLHPKRNILIPLCKSCHDELNCQGFKKEISMRAIKNVLGYMKRFIIKQEERIKKFEEKK